MSARDLTPAPAGYAIKLVRDGTPEMINSSGRPGELFYGPCVEDDVRHFLRMKLMEEVGEFLLDSSRKEMGDVLSVLWAICDHEGWDLQLIEEQELTHPRRGFQEHTMMYGRHLEFDH